MTKAYLIQNQHAQFLNKNGEWANGQENNAVYRTIHKDEAINVKVEQSSRDPELRLKLLACTLNEKGQPQIPPTEHDTSTQTTPAIDPELVNSFSLTSESATGYTPNEQVT